MFRRATLKNITCLVLIISVFLAGCGGHAPNPVDRYIPGDEKRSCSSLYAEIKEIDNEIAVKERKRRERDTWNVIEFIGGLLIIVPFFFMDTKGSYEAEIDALKARQKQLKIFFADNNCSIADLEKTSPSAGNP